MDSPAHRLLQQRNLRQLVHRLEVPTNLRLPYLSNKKDDALRIFRPVDFSKKKLVVFDLNRTMSADSLFHEAYLLRFITRLAQKIEDPAEVQKFLKGIERLGDPNCIYQRGNILLQDGSIITGSGELVGPNGERLSAPSSPSIKMHTMVDLPVQMRGLAMRRGLAMEEIFRLASESLRDTGVCPILPGFNDKLGNFLERNMFRKRYVLVTDTGELVATSILSLMRMDRFFRRDLIAGAEKSTNLPLIMLELMDKHKVDEREVLMIGDSWSSDIEPLAKIRVDGVHIAPPSTRYPHWGRPAVRASSLNSAIDYLEANSR